MQEQATEMDYGTKGGNGNGLEEKNRENGAADATQSVTMNSAFRSSYQHFGMNSNLPGESLFESDDDRPSNEYVLNIAFFSFFGFMLVQAGFALAVGSESMLADSEAMGVDAMTYLFNLCAERMKKAPYSSRELRLSADVREYRRKLKRLYLEVVPPLISVSTLIVVTIVTLYDALMTLFRYDNVDDDNGDGDNEMVAVMLFFSSLNLLLDMVNVVCFARADRAFGLNVIQAQKDFRKSLRATRRASDEWSSLLVSIRRTDISCRGQGETEGVEVQQAELEGIEVQDIHLDRTATSPSRAVEGTAEEEHDGDLDDSFALINLNMCSAWTHIFADTMRSIAVLVAAVVAFLFPTSVTPEDADATAAVVVSCIIFLSLLPLLQGLLLTTTQIRMLTRQSPDMAGTNLTV